MNKSQGSTVGSAAKALGFKGMWAGLGPRIIMIGTLTALQWFIYDGVKVNHQLNVKTLITILLPGPAPPSPPTSPRDARLLEGQDGCCSVLDLAIELSSRVDLPKQNNIIKTFKN